MSNWALASWAAWGVVVVLGATLRSRAYAIFRGVTLGVHTLIFLALLPHFGVLTPVALGFHFVLFADSLALIRATLRPTWYRILFSWPAQYMAAATLLALPWAVVAAFGFSPWGVWVPYALGALGMSQSLTSRLEYRDITVGDVGMIQGVERVTEGRPVDPRRVIRIAQITDPHLGPFMSIGRLKRISQRIVAEQPDLVFLTGDFLTMESHRDPEWLAEGLSPLAKLEGRVFACLGNHDHEALSTVQSALKQVHATLLVDAAVTVETPAGLVQVVGYDFHFQRRAERSRELFEAYPRKPNVLQLVLLHDPGAFKHLPPDAADLVLSGHTHGGQVGLVSFGGSWTVARAVAKIPDHGFWGLGRNRMYIHRGTGHYGFPLRLGVPGEQSIVSVHWV
ncbi:MAG: hypothetical protein RJA70_2732 [Pseudomonadota bacterium]|jgi:predicted MPP superfamily phosphohydrolase